MRLEDTTTFISIELLLLIVALLNLWLSHRKTICDSIRRRSRSAVRLLAKLTPPRMQTLARLREQRQP